MNNLTYRGRFAPAPSGPLHFGSIVAALGSYLQAKSQEGHWLVRIEDSDSFRVQDGATDNILRTLESLGLCWDEEVIFQSQREAIYQQALHQLDAKNLLYKCACSRKETKGKPYTGNCRDKSVTASKVRSIRLKTTNKKTEFLDKIQGKYSQQLETDVGDFIVDRADGMIAYHLAVVVDDARQNISEVVRGADLLPSTPRQIYLQELLGYETPEYCHLPVAVNSAGEKISKQNHASAIDLKQAVPVLYQALEFLGQAPDSKLLGSTPDDVLTWAVAHWDLNRIPRIREIQLSCNG